MAGGDQPGMTVSATVAVAEREVALAVKESGLQRFRDFTVVFAQIGQTYDLRMLELGARHGDRVEVLGGLEPSTRFVAEQSFLIKADIEKSGASHDRWSCCALTRLRSVMMTALVGRQPGRRGDGAQHRYGRGSAASAGDRGDRRHHLVDAADLAGAAGALPPAPS